ncbi:MAG TPA: hypothetical protein VFV89_04875 [Nocardioides sp.]|nr:hypothetical protein [Nocardioides sp.]HEX5087120.1 hypothetical protein [Nocardioides sp.]
MSTSAIERTLRPVARLRGRVEQLESGGRVAHRVLSSLSTSPFS